MAFNIDKFISDMFGNSKTDNNTNAKKRITKKKDDGGKAKLRASQDKDNAKRMKDSKGQGYSGTGINSGTTRVRKGPKRSTLVLTDGAGTVTKSKDNLKDRRIALAAKKEKASIDKAYNRSSALSTIKKDTNLAGNKKTSNKKVVVTKAQLEKSGMNLRDYMNMLKSKKTGRDISRDSRFDKKKPKMYNSIYSDKKITAAQRLKEIGKEKLIATQKKLKRGNK